MFTPDPKTLSLAVGLTNLVFALLATLYIAKMRLSNPALETWRWGRLLAGSGYLVNLTSGVAPDWVPPVLGNLFQVLAAGCDIAAYCMLLERARWQRPLKLLVGGSVIGLIVVSLASAGQSPRLLLFSALGVLFYGVLAGLALRNSRGEWLLKLIGLIDIMLILVFLLRIGKGLAFEPLIRFDNDLITLLLYLTLFLVVMINGFGFLLLVKQKDDETLYQALAALEQADEDRQQFLTQASHEFRTPVAMMKASLDSLRFLGDRIPVEVASRLENIRLGAQRLHDLSDTLLTQHRLNHPSLLFKQANADLGELLRDLLKCYPPAARLEATLPETPVLLEFDPAQVRIAVHNLIDNALEHTPANSGPVQIFLRSTPNDVEICVADTGSGIADSEKPSVFRRFRNPQGHFVRGIGLSIVARIAANHGGDALVRDNLPKGTVMVLRLPKGEAAPAEPPHNTQASASGK